MRRKPLSLIIALILAVLTVMGLTVWLVSKRLSSNTNGSDFRVTVIASDGKDKRPTGKVVQLPGLPQDGNVIAIAAGFSHSLALKRDGTVVGWGYGDAGPVTPPKGLTDVVAIAAGYGHSLALKRDGTVVRWGLKNHDQATPPGL